MSVITKIILGVIAFYVLCFFIGAIVADIKRPQCPKCGSRNLDCIARTFSRSETTSIKKTVREKTYDTSHSQTGYCDRSIYVPATRQYYKNDVKCQKCGTTFCFEDSHIVE